MSSMLNIHTNTQGGVAVLLDKMLFATSFDE